MPGQFIKFAAITFLIYLGLFAWLEQHPESTFSGIENIPLALSGICLAIAVVLFVAQLSSRISHHAHQGKCIRCGAKTEKGMVYCEKHLKDARRELVDKRMQEGGINQ